MNQSIADKLTQRLAREVDKKGALERASDYNQKLKRLGVDKRPDYKIDPVDTIGFKLYQDRKA
jgi:hypothetical protein